MKMYENVVTILLFTIIGGILFMVLDIIWDFISVELNHKIGKTILIFILLLVVLFIFYPDDNHPDPSMY